ncbi:unnamed protein product [Fraxinus pennsylvanica]|uniref:Uncharacterized protein n=1 Tax=Fraxinus pennsylvanica TaxID=56036 RepID=A0AAD2A352_9LAMI|nr:unnamed protein product [Fraxinus pennsylvanica]
MWGGDPLFARMNAASRPILHDVTVVWPISAYSLFGVGDPLMSFSFQKQASGAGATLEQKDDEDNMPDLVDGETFEAAAEGGTHRSSLLIFCHPHILTVFAVAKEYCERLGVDSCIKIFEQFKSYEGLYFFLGSYLSSKQFLKKARDFALQGLSAEPLYILYWLACVLIFALLQRGS